MFQNIWLSITAKIACFRATSYCLNLAAEQEKIVTDKWLPELKAAVSNAHNCFEDCRYVAGLVSTTDDQQIVGITHFFPSNIT